MIVNYQFDLHKFIDDFSLDKAFRLLQREHGTGCRRSWNCCNRWTCFVAI